MQPPKPKLGVDPARSRDIMDDMVNAVRPDARSFAARRPRGVAIRFENERSPRDSPRLSAPPPHPPSPRSPQVETYVADGFDAFEVSEPGARRRRRDDGGAEAGPRRRVQGGAGGIDEHFGRFAEHAGNACFAVPKELLQAQDLAENLPSCSAEEERVLDEQLRALRKRVAHAVATREHCDAQRETWRRGLRTARRWWSGCGRGRKRRLGSVKGGRAGVESAAAAVVAAAGQLQPLLEQAEEMQRTGFAFSDDSGVVPGGWARGCGGGAAEALRQRNQPEVLKSINSRINARKAAEGGGR